MALALTQITERRMKTDLAASLMKSMVSSCGVESTTTKTLIPKRCAVNVEEGQGKVNILP